MAPADNNNNNNNNNNSTRRQNTNHIGHNETAVDNDSDIFEFFDLQKAALDPDSAQPSPSEPQLTSATTSATLCSKGSHGILQFPNETATHLPLNVVLNVSRGDRKPDLAKWTTTAPPPLYHWPIEHIVSRNLFALLPLSLWNELTQPPDNTHSTLSG